MTNSRTGSNTSGRRMIGVGIAVMIAGVCGLLASSGWIAGSTNFSGFTICAFLAASGLLPLFVGIGMRSRQD